MKRTIPTAAVLLAATLFVATSAHAQGRGSDAYPPGPTGQAAAQTTNVSVVNSPTVAIGNVVSVKEAAKEPLYYQTPLFLGVAATYVQGPSYDVPAGKRLVLENVTVSCSMPAGQPVNVAIYGPIPGGFPMLSFIPTTVPWGNGSIASQVYPVHVLVDGSLQFTASRPTTASVTNCTLTLIGYFTPVP